MRRNNPQSGYTLVELLVVIAIIGLIASLAAPTATNTIDIVQLRSDQRIVVAGLRKLQSNAIEERHTVTLSTPDDLAAADLRTQRVSVSTELRIEEPITWFADGTTTGGHLVLRRGNRARTIVIAWLSGTISVE